MDYKQSSSRPQCTISKPPTYADPTDESSQGSQVIGTIYSLDKRPIPDEKLEKIVGLSEPSAYRMGAQNYIAAKHRGELPAPPLKLCPVSKQTIPKLNNLRSPKLGMKARIVILLSSTPPPKTPGQNRHSKENQREITHQKAQPAQG